MATPPSPLGRAYGPIDTRQDEAVRPVRSADEWRSVMTAIVKRPGASRGTTVQLSRAFTVDRPLMVPEGCDGLVVRAASFFKMRPKGAVAALFDVRSDEVVIEGVRAVSDPSTFGVGGVRGANYFRAFAKGVARTFTTFRCYGEADVWIEGVTQFPSYRLNCVLCSFLTTDPLSTSSIVVTGDGGNVIAFNEFNGGPLFTNNTTNSALFVGNIALKGINTSSQAVGNNRLVANICEPGTKNLHADDIDADKGAAGWTTVTKTATETIISDATQNDDAELLFPMEANTTYRFRGCLFVRSDTTADFRSGLAGPAGPTLVHWTMRGVSTSGNKIFNAYSDGGAWVFNTPEESLWIDGTIQNGATAGNARIRWAQGTSTAVNTSVLKGSYVEYAADT